LSLSPAARRLGITAAIALVALGLAYAVVLAAGLAGLAAPDEAIGGRVFTLLELLILPVAPLMVVLMMVVHAWAAPERRVFSLGALVFTSMLAALTCSVHFVILTVGHRLAIDDAARWSRLLSFDWPSVAYAIDILAWDLFFGLAMLFAAPVFRGDRLTSAIRWLLVASGGLALAGLAGVVVDMRLRMLGVVGYAVVFPVMALLLAVLFARQPDSPERVIRTPDVAPRAGDR
jgi:hypothetical protein